MNADLLRWIGAALAFLDVSMLAMGAISRWHTFTPRLRRIVPWVLATYVVITYGLGEAASDRTPIPAGLRVPLMLLVLLVLLVALVYRFTDDD